MTDKNSINLWQHALISEDSTLQDAIQNLDETGLQICLVISTTGVLLGTITDGDIRRGLLRGLGMRKPVGEIINSEPLVAPPQLDRNQILKLMQANSVRQLPIVDQNHRVIGLHLLDNLMVPGQRQNTMVIMAGGQGTRLRPHTKNCPKPLLPVAGKPMLEHIIERAKTEGFENFVIAIYYLGHMIEEYFGDGSKWQIKINYIKESTPLGTAGALSLFQEKRPNVPFIVTNGDVLTDIHYGELLDFHCRQNAMATMAVRLHEWQHPFGVVQTKGVDIIGFEEKPIARSHINAGVYVLEPSAIDHLEVGECCNMPTLFKRLQKSSERTIAYPMHEPWLDVGRPDDYMRANALNNKN